MIELENFNCKIFTDYVEPGAMETIYEVCRNKAFEGKQVRVMPDCLTEDTEILTSEGFIKLSSVLPNMLISNYDPITKHIEFKPPVGIINRELRENEKVYEYRNSRGFSFKVSENHRMALRTRLGEKACQILEFNTKDYIFCANGINESLRLTKYSDNDIRLICWIVGDGNIKITHNRRSDNLRIRFGLKKERKIERVEELLNEENLIYTKSITEKETEIVINTESSKKYIDFVTKYKKFPKDFIYLSKNQANIFFEELIKVDGDYERYIKTDKGSYRVNSKDEDTLNLISAICSINYGTSFIKTRVVKNSYIEGTNLGYINVIKENKLIFSKNGLHNSKFSRKEVNYSGKLVCVETNTGFFIARQGGMTFVTGNCHQGEGIVIGFTAPLGDWVNPDHVGCDLGCSISALFMSEPIPADKYPLFEHRLKKTFPLGKRLQEQRMFEVKDFLKFLRESLRKAYQKTGGLTIVPEFQDEDDLEEWMKDVGIDPATFYKSIGTIGGGEEMIASILVNS